MTGEGYRIRLLWQSRDNEDIKLGDQVARDCKLASSCNVGAEERDKREE